MWFHRNTFTLCLVKRKAAVTRLTRILTRNLVTLTHLRPHIECNSRIELVRMKRRRGQPVWHAWMFLNLKLSEIKSNFFVTFNLSFSKHVREIDCTIAALRVGPFSVWKVIPCGLNDWGSLAGNSKNFSFRSVYKPNLGPTQRHIQGYRGREADTHLLLVSRLRIDGV